MVNLSLGVSRHDQYGSLTCTANVNRLTNQSQLFTFCIAIFFRCNCHRLILLSPLSSLSCDWTDSPPSSLPCDWMDSLLSSLSCDWTDSPQKLLRGRVISRSRALFVTCDMICHCCQPYDVTSRATTCSAFETANLPH